MSVHQYIKQTFEHLHQYPEVAFTEFKTSDFIASELERLGFEVRRGLGKTGLVGMLRFSQDGPCVALRADMDALPIHEETGVSYASRNPGVMHACGHDSHMTIALACCAYFAENKDSYKGSFMAIFQPAEEIVAGAQAMLDDGVFADVKPDVLFAMHNWPQLPVGSIGIQAGPVTAYADRFKVELRGVGGHGAFPNTTRDPIAMAATAIQSTFSLVNRRCDPKRPRAVSFGIIQGGSSFNIIPEKVVIEGTARIVSLEDQEEIIELLHQSFSSAAALHNGTYQLEYTKGVPAVVNDTEVCQDVVEILSRNFPGMNVATTDLAVLAGEDVTYFLQEVPGAWILFGTRQSGHTNELHNPKYLVPQESLIEGYDVMRTILADYLKP